MDGKIEEGSGIYTVNTTIIGIDSANQEETKGQLISKANFLVLIWTKKWLKLFFDFYPKNVK